MLYREHAPLAALAPIEQLLEPRIAQTRLFGANVWLDNMP